MERSLLDTDTFSEVLRGRDAAIRDKADAYLSVFGRFTFSVTTVTELIDGLRRQGRDDRITWLLGKLESERHETISIDLDVAKIAGHIFGDLHRDWTANWSERSIHRGDRNSRGFAVSNRQHQAL